MSFRNPIREETVEIMPEERILIAENCSENLAILKQTFSDQSVSVFEDGEALLREAQEGSPPALILLSASLPALDAFALCRRLRSSEITVEIPVIFLLDSGDGEKPEPIFDAGGTDYLISPLHQNTVRARLSVYLKLHQLLQERQELKRHMQVEPLTTPDEESLHAYVHRLQAVIDMAGEGVTLSDEQGYFEFYNSKMREITGYSREDANSCEDFLTLLHPDLPERYAALFAIHEVKESWRSRNIETNIHAKDGSIKTLLVSTSMLYDRGRPWFLSIYHDITERKAMERALLESEERFRSFAEHSLDVIMRFDRHHRHLYVNPIVEKQIGIPPCEFIGKTHAELGFPEELVRVWSETLEAVFRSGESKRIEFEYPAGFWIDWQVIPETYSLEGNVDTVITAARDITQLKQDEAELVRREANLSFLVDIQQQLLSSSFHIEPRFESMLASLGRLTKVSRVYVFENSRDIEGRLCMNQIAEWCAPDVEPQIDIPLLQNLPYDACPYWREQLEQGRFLCSIVAELPEQEREILEQQGVLSVLVLPLVIHGKFSGFIGFDDCMSVRHWANADISLLQAVAAAMSSAQETELAERGLQAAYERFATVMNAIDSSIYVADMESYEILFVNDYTRKTLGAAEGDTCWKVLQTGQNGPCEFCTNAKLVADGVSLGPYHWEFRNTIDGHWYYLRDQAIRWIDGRLVRLEIATDITGLKKVEEDLRESRALFRSAFEKSGVGMLLIDVETMKILEVNAEFCEVLGYTREELLGKTPSLLTHPDDLDLGTLEIQEAREGKRETFQLEKRYLHQNGTVVWGLLSAAIVYDKQECPSFFVMHVQNITERKLAEAQAQKQRRIAESLRQVSLVLNSSLNRTTVLEKILEQIQRVVQCDNAAIFLPEDDDLVLAETLEKGKAYIGKRVKRNSDDPVAFVMRRKTSHIIPDITREPHWTRWPGEGGSSIKSWMGTPLLIGELAIGVLTVDSFHFHNYTEEDAHVQQSFANHAALAIYNARLFDEAMTARKDAEIADDAKSEFLGRVSHELRTPLHIIIGMTYVVQSETLTQKQRKRLEDVQKASNRLLRLINEMLDFSKMETGKLRIEARLFRLDDVLRNLFARHEKDLEHDVLKLGFCIEQAVPHSLFGDPLHLEHVLENLLDNAVKFTPSGEIALHVSQVSSAEDTENVMLRFSLSDSGIGIPQKQLNDIFSPFYQVDGSKTRKYGGTGLGLSVCKRLVELMQGEIRVESTLGQGSLVILTLPFGLPERVAEFDAAKAVFQGQSEPPARLELQQDMPPKSDGDDGNVDVDAALTPADRADVKFLLQQLAGLLEEGDIEAVAWIETLNSHLQKQNKLFVEVVREIQESIGQYDFEKALLTLRKLIHSFES